MNCYTAGIVGVGMLGATVSTMTVSKEQSEQLRRVLSPEKAAIYQSIEKERKTIYLQGLFLGLMVAFLVVRMIKPAQLFYRITLMFAVSLLITVIYYSIIPKSDYMLNHLSGQKENKAWLAVYNTMKHRYMYGFLLGACSAIPLGYIMC